MPLLHSATCRRCFSQSAVLALLSAPFAIFGRRAAFAEEGQGTQTPGGPLSARSHVLDTGADMLQSKPPLDAISAFLNGFHFYADDMGRQIEASHFCTHVTEEFYQCVIFDSNRREAKLIGVEYIVSERIFKSLPDEEKKLWHSHNYEVKSGQLIAPGVPQLAEHAVMDDLQSTYGKTWHTWQIDRYQDLPLGIPQLMMGFTQDGQANPQMVQDRDKRFGISSEQRRKDRGDLPMSQTIAGANSWQSGRVPQLALQEVAVRNIRR